ncbi:hypothetical protein T12_6755 [Trichinella patagoniensis]|uniref:Uncharacterized protein n=1 Tax=Trichinella patagoniensis TaxID=990121 RepID=A0A0V0ZXH0_9BILA|nr:hypothetical protein T12_6755 [Trichinella patagoniensis]
MQCEEQQTINEKVILEETFPPLIATSYLRDDEKYKLDLPWIDQTPKSPAGHGLVSPKGEQPKSSRLHFSHRRVFLARLGIVSTSPSVRTWVKVRCVALCLDLHATVANSRNYKFTQLTNTNYFSQLPDALPVQNKMWSSAVTQRWRIFEAT